MIVEQLPLLTGRTEAAGPGPDRRPGGTGDGAFGRTLNEALRADRADRPTRRDDRPESNDDRSDERIGDERPAATNEKVNDREPTEEDFGDDRQGADGDRPAETHSRRSPVVDGETDGERVAGHPEAVEVGDIAESAEIAVQDLAVNMVDDHGAADQVAVPEPAGPAASAGAVFGEPVVIAATPDGDTVDGLAPASDGNIAGETVPMSTGATDDGGGANGTTLDDTDAATGTEDRAEAAGRINRPASNVGSVDGSIESSDEMEDTGNVATGPATGTNMAPESTPDESAVTESIAAVAASAVMADRRSSTVPDAEPTNASMQSLSSTPKPDAAAVAPLGQQATAGEPETGSDPATGDPMPAPDATDLADLVDHTEAQPETGSDEMVEHPTRPAGDRPAPGVSPATALRVPASVPIRPATAAVETSHPAPELVELQTAGLAERLRPAFAAVRRGVNGLDELRLRIRDDNAGPIKVDISTIDNRVRVLLSAGSDDLMRQLGQERDRLADELRRAGFDQASIDIEANDRGRRHGHYDQEASDQSRSGAARPQPSAATVADSIERASSRPHRASTGLDLDL